MHTKYLFKELLICIVLPNFYCYVQLTQDAYYVPGILLSTF